MAARFEALRRTTAAWTLTLTTAQEPQVQLKGLIRALGRQDAGSLRSAVEVCTPGAQTVTVISTPSVFENTAYTLTLIPEAGWEITEVRHPVRQDVGDSLERIGIAPGLWHGTLNTGNNIGWFPLEIALRPLGGDGAVRIHRVAWQVWPLKLDYASDLNAMTKKIEEIYPLWLFRFDTPTVHDTGPSSRRDDSFLLMWFAQFDRLWKQMERGLKTVVRTPHVTLDGQPAFLRADRLKGRFGHRLEHSVVSGRDNPVKKYAVELWRSSRDTPENRFILYVADKSLLGLERFLELVESPGLSSSFRDLMTGRIRKIRAFRAEPLFRGVGAYTGLTQESLVLQQRAGYSTVYRVWLELRHQLEFFAGLTSARVGMRSVNEIYEIWCFLEVRRILKELGLTERSHQRPRWQNRGVQRELAGSGSAFIFDGPSNLEVRLSHEPTFGSSQGHGLRSYTVNQRPDIVLEVLVPKQENSQRLIWIFDAKYRLKGTSDDPMGRDDRAGEWLVPPDALDQMHRYRDSIVLRLQDGKSRPVVSAFALYPGPIDQSRAPESNPYWFGIDEVGIGAFPLVPATNGSRWLKEFLRESFEPLANWEPAHVLDRDNVRIPVTGLSYREDDLLFVTADRLVEPDFESLREGTAETLALPNEFHPDPRRISRVTWIAIAFPGGNPANRVVTGAYRVDDGWSVAGIVTLSNFVATPLSVERSWSAGPWFRYSDLRSLLSSS